MEINGIMTTWKGTAMDAIINAKVILELFHVAWRTRNQAAMEEKSRRMATLQAVTKKLLPNERKKLIFSIAFL
mgnify:CR=1 FL=1